MPVECYALITFNRSVKNEDYTVYEKRKFYRSGDVKTPETHLCHLRLMQPLGKNGRVPIPRWEIVEKVPCVAIFTGDYKKQEHTWLINSYLTSQAIHHDGNGIHTTLDKNVPLLFGSFHGSYSTGTQEPKMLERIDDKRIQLRQIRSLFPECAKMPMAIALDYIRDRM